MKRKILGLILARGGSKSVPKKNIKLLAGKPLISFTIEEAKKSKYINRLVVSTDSKEIAKIAKKYGAEVPFMRPLELAQDNTQDFSVFAHALRWLRDKENYVPDIIVHLRPTSPLRRAEHIDAAVEALIKSKGDVVKSVSLVNHHPHKMWKIRGDRIVPFCLNMLWKKQGPDVPRQKLEPVYRHNGVVDVFRPSILEKPLRYEKIRFIPYVMDDKFSVDLDSNEDFLYAEFLMKARKGT